MLAEISIIIIIIRNTVDWVKFEPVRSRLPGGSSTTAPSKDLSYQADNDITLIVQQWYLKNISPLYSRQGLWLGERIMYKERTVENEQRKHAKSRGMI